MTVTIDGSAGVTTNTGAVYNSIQSGTAVASTSGTSIDFTGIPSWVKRITVMLNGVSTSGTSNLLLRGGSGSIETTGYVSTGSSLVGGTGGTATDTTGHLISSSVNAASNWSGNIVLNLVSSNNWVFSEVLARSDGVNYVSGTTKTFSGTLDRLRITTVNGTDTFDAGSINILYE